MVSLTMMARLLEAVRPDARLVLVGDPDQLASVEAGAVLADLVAGFEGSPDSPVRRAAAPPTATAQHIGALAQALRDGDADDVMAALRAGSDEVELVDPDDEAAMTGFRASVTDVAVDAAAGRRARRRRGRARGARASTGCSAPTARAPTASAAGTAWSSGCVAERTGVTHYDEWYAGRPILVTANDYDQLLNNGDMGVTIRCRRRADGRLRVVVQVGGRRCASSPPPGSPAWRPCTR